MACGCSDNACNCTVQGEGHIVVSGTGSSADPYLVTFTETTFAGVEGDGIEITAGGTRGHTPTFELKIDPASNADVSLSPDGLLINIPTDDTVPSAAFVSGMMMDYAGTIAPSGWFLADGSLKDKTTYASLYAACGGAAHTYNGGVDPGGNNFRLPDALGRTTYGPKASDNIGDMDGAYGSESAIGKTHSHTTSGTTSSDATGLTVDSLAAGTRTDNATDEGEGSSHHLGHILRDTGANALCVDADLTFGDDEVAPSLSGCASSGGGDNFTKLSHDHDFTHGHSVTDPTHDHTTSGTTDSEEIPHLIVNKIIKI